MVECSWVGFIGYVFAFIFFFIGAILNIINMFNQYNTAKKTGFNYNYKVKDWFLETPLKALCTSFIIALVAFYISLIYLIPIIIKYWKCLL